MTKLIFFWTPRLFLVLAVLRADISAFAYRDQGPIERWVWLAIGMFAGAWSIYQVGWVQSIKVEDIKP